MKKSKGLLVGMMLIVVAMLTACSNVPKPTEKDVLKALEKEGYISGIDNEECSVQMDEVEIDDDKEGATVECVVSYEEDLVRKSTEYKIKFKIRDDKETWKVKKVTERDTTYELIKGISNESLEDLLRWESYLIENNYINFDSSNTTYNVLNHELRCQEMIDVVTMEVNGKLGYKSAKVTVKYTLSYVCNGDQGYWNIQEKEIIGTETAFVEGYVVTLSEDRVLEDIISKKSYVYMLGTSYYLTDENVSFSNIKIGESVYDGYYMYVPVSLTATYDKVSFDIHCNLAYYFDTYDMKWYANGFMDISCDNFNSDIIGVWTGTSEGNQVVLTINKDWHAAHTSYLDVKVEVTTSTGIYYSYSAYLREYDPSSNYICIYGYSWIVEPTGYHYQDDFVGYCIDGEMSPYYSWDDFKLTKTN